jgi:hypothetical protein
MIKVLLIVVVVSIFLLIFGATAASLLGVLDLTILDDFLEVVGDIFSTISIQYDLLLVAFPLTLNFVLIAIMLGLIRLVGSNLAKK